MKNLERDDIWEFLLELSKGKKKKPELKKARAICQKFSKK